VLRVGLTGGTGAGKSTVARRLADHGAVVIDADRVAREVVESGTDALAEIVAEFGSAVLLDDGRLDRAALGRRVFGDSAARARLNAIVHPRVARRTEQLVAELPGDRVVVHDVPLLVENRLAPTYPLVVVVLAPTERRVSRLVEARGLSAEEARARIASQAGDAERVAVADVVLVNDAALADLHAAVDALWTDRIAPYAENLRACRRAAPPDVELVPYDESWPAQAARLVERIRLAGGRRVLRVDHVGSTAVPGLAAKDVLDLQVIVASLAQADALAPDLHRVGLPLVPGVTGDTPHPAGADQERWRKRMHASADPGRLAHVHVRVAGWPGERIAVQFRDWLRAVPAARSEYEREKRRLAAVFSRPTEYAAAKEAWFAGALPRAAAWAEAAPVPEPEPEPQPGPEPEPEPQPGPEPEETVGPPA